MKQRNQSLLATAEAEGRLRVLRRSQVLEIRPESVKLDRNGKPAELPNAYVFVLIGGESPEGFLQKNGVEILEKAISLPA